MPSSVWGPSAAIIGKLVDHFGPSSRRKPFRLSAARTRTATSPINSPSRSCTEARLIDAPKRNQKVEHLSARPGLSPTLWSMTCDSGKISAAAIRNTAAEQIARHDQALRCNFVSRLDLLPPPRPFDTSTAAPNSAQSQFRMVARAHLLNHSRRAVGVQSPRAAPPTSPARSGIGRVYSMPFNFLAAVSRAAPCRLGRSKSPAPILRRGSITRRIGRRRSDPSPP